MKRIAAVLLAIVLVITVLPLALVSNASGATLVAEYNFDNQTTADSVGGKNATLYNNSSAASASFTDGISGKALKLSSKGSSEKLWLSVPYSVFGSCRDSFSISLWYNASGYNTSGEDSELFSFYNSSAEKFLFYSPASVSFQDKAFTMKWDGTYGYANVITPYRANTWVHLVYVVTNDGSSSKIAAYVNGSAVEVDQGGEWANSLMSQLGINNFTIGGKNPYKGGDSPACLFYGSVDEVKIYAGALTQSDAAAIYEDDKTGKTEDPTEPSTEAPTEPTEPVESGTLLAEYNFNDNSTKDSVAGRNATLYNNASPTAGKYDGGVSGNGLRLSTKGSGEKYWLSIPYSVFGSYQDDFTLSLWYKADDYNTSGEDSELFSLYNGGAEKFLFYSPASVGFQDKAFSMMWNGNYGYANVITPYAKSQWVHLCFAVSSENGKTKITAYVNGKEVEVDQGGEWANSLMSQLGINTFTIGGKNPYKGGDSPTCLFYGMVDEIRLYSGKLTQSDAAALYAKGNPNGVPYEEPDDPTDEPGDEPVKAELLAEYNFDKESTVDSVAGKNATLYNDADKASGKYTEGVSGKALKLSTKGTLEKYWLSVPYSVFGSSRDSFSLSMWYKGTGYNTSGEDSELFSFYNSSAEKFVYYSPAAVEFQDKAFTMKWDGTYGYTNVISPFEEGAWTHIVFCVEARGSESYITAYVNGEAVEIDRGENWANSLMSQLGIDTFTIGGKNPYKGGPTPMCLFYGSVDEIRLYSGVLTEEEAKTLYDNPGYNGEHDGDDDDPTQEEVSGKLLAEYNFDNSNTKDSVAGKNATLYNNATRVSGKYVTGVNGKALQLSTKGAGDKMWLSVPYSVFNGNQDTFTISMWYAATGYNAKGEDSELFSFYNSRSEKFLFHSPASTAFTDKGFTMKWNGRNDGYANVISPYAKNKWVHLVYVVKGKDNQSVITAYVNGEPVEVDQGGNWANSTMSKLGINTFTIGGKNPYKGGDSPACLFYGLVDEIRLYAGELTPADAKILYQQGNSNAAVKTAGAYAAPAAPKNPVDAAPGDGVLMAEYNFNYEHTKDSVGDNDATFYDNATAGTGEYVDGVAGKGLRLSEQGTAEKFWLSVPIEAFGDNRDNISISLWYKADGFNAAGEDSELFSLYNSKAERFIFYSPAAVAFQDKGFTMKWDGSYGYANVISPYQAGKWTHLVYVINGKDNQSVIRAYVNGKAVEVDQGGAWANSLLSQLGIDTFTIGGKNPNKGGDPPACLFYGAIDEVKLFAGTLTQVDAQRLYEEPKDYVFVPEETEDPEETEPAEETTETFTETEGQEPDEPADSAEKKGMASALKTGLILTGSTAAVSIGGVIAALLLKKKRKGK